jgi:hypothetical protein
LGKQQQQPQLLQKRQHVNKAMIDSTPPNYSHDGKAGANGARRGKLMMTFIHHPIT